MPPDGDWRSWVIMGGRGAGKTRAGAEWVRSEVEGATPLGKGRSKAVALIGETFDQVREVMVFGDSGILACSPPDRRPEWQATRRRLVWPNGAVAWAFSAQEPEALRGPQFDAAWVDEIAKWRKAGDVWDMLQFALRLGNSPRQVVTTTPRNEPTLKRILGMPTTVVTTAPTEANRANLAGSFLEEVRARYAGTRLGRQELDGVLLEDTQGALWSHASLEAIGVDILPELDRVVVAVDPPASSDGDDCGIVVAGAITKGPPSTWQAYVLQDATVIGQTPLGWAKAAVDALEANGADRLVAEINQGGAMVETIVRQVDPLVSYRGVHASRGKVARAEPVAALYEQGRVYHARGLGSLEDQMTQMTTQGFAGQGSPDRVDALVWALTDLMIEPARKFQEPRMRTL
ncbi:DNA-packaging protein [Shimia ponticola]|uniref:DNA-packaging protein n=1 Tax=Shimia ponticola TaxID=2582893 RepID=UPI002102ECB7|nr:terminase family protein [Shimia ponticola]